ncbi:hypothetical protein PIB30_052593 [Stylosanthes scabra]|uniref:Uncharacterized protein n=1 Tax=Stylosanthes scabra TaxID=79078 RepID=A0ABU6QIK8_9FABA|nr:hypothetical protein [Stylosanthes scabra]
MEPQELQIQNHSNDVSGNVNANGNSNGGGSGGGRSSKKPKQKKVPQRGLGVAQLEKLRMEEIQKKNAAAIFSQQQQQQQGSVVSTNSTYMPLSIQNFHDSNPPPPRSQPEFRSVSVQQKVPPCTGTVPLTNSAMQFLPNFPYESNHVWPLPNLGQRAPQFHYQLPSSMANVSPAGISSTPNFSREPPSNQNCNDNNGLLGRQAEKIIGVKRPYPFCLDAPPMQIDPEVNLGLPLVIIEHRFAGLGLDCDGRPCSGSATPLVEVPTDRTVRRAGLWVHLGPIRLAISRLNGLSCSSSANFLV